MHGGGWVRSAERAAAILLCLLTLLLLKNGLLVTVPSRAGVAPDGSPQPTSKPTQQSSTALETVAAKKSEQPPTTAAPLNPHPFRFTILEANVCSKLRPDLYILVIVHTAPGNHKRRMQIRETYASQRLYAQTKVVALFAMGMPKDNNTQASIRLESSVYRDVIQEDFVDSYKNLTYKGVMWLRYVTQHCPQAQWVLKVDDDIFVNIFNLVAHLRSLEKHKELQRRQFLCLLWTRMPVLRDTTSKWFVSKTEYDKDYYTQYCSGSAFLVSAELVPLLYAASFRTPFFWVDDFYLTGLLPLNASAEYKNIASLYVLKKELFQEKIVRGFAIFAHVPGNSLKARYHLWSQVVSQRGYTSDPKESSFLLPTR